MNKNIRIKSASESPNATVEASNGNATTPDMEVFDDLCGDLDLRIARDGTWFYHGSPIGRKPLVKLFSTVLRRDDAGDYWLITPAEKGRIEVDDVPFVAVEMDVMGQGKSQSITVRTNIDDIVTVGPENPLRVEINPDTGEPSPYVLVRDRLEARLNRPVYYQMAEICEQRCIDDQEIYGVWSNGAFFSLGPVEKSDANEDNEGTNAG